jgi:beta-lactamase class A
MISISDNTATDQLIDVLGRERVLKLMRDTGHSAPHHNDPLLTTLDLFELKASGPALIEAWRSSDRDARAAILEQLTEHEISAERVEAAFSSGPNAIDIEWFATPRDLVGLFKHMRRKSSRAVLPIMAINPNMSPATKANWNYAGYKGGSEPGVLNLTWLLEDKSGEWHILTLGWSNPDAAVDEEALGLIAQRILAMPGG